MIKKIINFSLLAIFVVTIAGCTAGSTIQINTPDLNLPAGTPTPSGQINVPAFKLEVSVPGSNPLVNKVDANNRVAGILQGIWHGIISPVILVLSFINPNMQMYEVHNNGSQYNFGFLIGVAIVFLLLGITAGRRYR